jgi:hypothetical protein
MKVPPLALALALLVSNALAFEGDGTLTAKGQDRFEIDLGPIDLHAAGRREYAFKDLPEREFTFGLRFTAPAGERLRHLPNATVRLRMLNESEDVLFDATDELANWLRAESSREWFLYLRGVAQGESTALPARRTGSYRLLFETVRADSTMSKFAVRLIAVGGGVK